MEALISYLKKNLKIYLLFICFIIIFHIVFFLYNYNYEVIFYAGIHCFILAFIVSVVDFINYNRSYKQLRFLENHVLDSLDKLPQSLDKRIEYYHKIIEKLFYEVAELRENQGRNYNDTIDYFSMWVHQIKTPIAAMTFLLEQEDVDESRLKLELFKIERYVEMVLNYLRLGSETTDYVIEKINLEAIARDTVKKFAPLFINKKIKLEFVSHETNIISDKKWLGFALEQIVSNAIKYNKEQGIIKIVVENDSITIEDSGIGIKDEDLPRIFDKGFTGFNGRYEKKSSGIGLYLCKKTLDNLGHRLSINSQLGVGTKITITFPEENFRD